jgi:xanthine dehydrogenase accessory factor
MDVFIDIWSPGADLGIVRQLADAATHSRPAALLTVVDSGHSSTAPAGARAVLDPAFSDAQLNPPMELPRRAIAQLAARTRDGVPALIEISETGGANPVPRIDASTEVRLFLDPIAGAQRLVIAGAGHIAQPLAQIGAMLGFHVTVIDDRAAFANRERFPDADEVVVRPFAAAIAALNLDRHCYLVSVTRGHSFDEEVVRTALEHTKGAFIGMIGSRRRVRATLDRLGESGISAELLDRVHAPLGIDIGAETPEEIAVSIIAEIVRDRRTGIRDGANLGVKSGRLRPSSRA